MLQNYRNHINKKKVEKTIYDNRLGETGQELISAEDHYNNLLKARFVIAEVAKQTQHKFVQYVENMGTLAIKTVFDRDFRFLVNFEIKRNKSECMLLIQEGDQEPFIPSAELGGGVLDVISFALRIILWSLQNPRTRNTILLDEPFRFLGDLTPLAGTMLKELSRKMNIQFIVTTHSSELAEFADRSWNVSIENGISKVIPNFEEEKPKVLKRRRIAN